MKRQKYTAYLSTAHLKALFEMAKEIKKPISYIIGAALDDWLIRHGKLMIPEFESINLPLALSQGDLSQNLAAMLQKKYGGTG